MTIAKDELEACLSVITSALGFHQEWLTPSIWFKAHTALRREYARLYKNIKRSRKAAKNRVMYKTFGRRPWDRTKISIIAGRLMEYTLPPGDVLLYMDAKRRMSHLREPSGFKEMSKHADAVLAYQEFHDDDAFATFDPCEGPSRKGFV